MPRKEIEELLDVAAVGFERLWRIAPLSAQMGEPALDLGSDGFRSARPRGSGDRGFSVLRTGFPLARERAGAVRGHVQSLNPSPFPFLKCGESGQPFLWPNASSMSWCRSRSTGPIRTGCRRHCRSRPATSCRCRSARATRRRWCGRTIPSPIRGSITGSRMSRKSSICRRSRTSCAASSTGLRITR